MSSREFFQKTNEYLVCISFYSLLIHRKNSCYLACYLVALFHSYYYYLHFIFLSPLKCTWLMQIFDIIINARLSQIFWSWGRSCSLRNCLDEGEQSTVHTVLDRGCLNKLRPLKHAGCICMLLRKTAVSIHEQGVLKCIV